MKTSTLGLLALAPTIALAWAGCGEDTGVIDDDGSGGSGATGSGTFPYTPEECSYDVTVPDELDDSGFHADETGTDPAPDHVHISYAGDPTSSFAVNWRTDKGGAEATKATVLLFGTDEQAVRNADGPGDGVQMRTGHYMRYGGLFDGDRKTQVHEVHVCGLDANTQYFYKVGGAGVWSDVYDATTSPEIGDTGTWRFAVTGDSRNDTQILAEVQKAVADNGVDLQLFSGDAVVLGPNQSEWDDFFEASTGDFSVQDIFARVPFMVANGNHDNLTVNYVAQFAVPQASRSAGAKAQGEEFYSFDYANAHFVFLNDTPNTRATGEQAEWLRDDLAAVDRTKTPWVFVTHHQPAYSCSTNHGSDLDIRQAWQPIYDQFEVDVVWTGHDHDYERSKPIRGFQTGSVDGNLAETAGNGVPVKGSGTIYVVAAGAGAPLYGVDPSCFHTLKTESTRNYVIVEIEDTTMRYTAYRLDGSVLDEFSYTK